MAEKIVLAELDINIKEVLLKAAETKTQILEMKKAQDDLKKSGEEGSVQFVRNEAELKSLSVVYRSHTAAIQAQFGEGGKLQNQQESINASISKLNLSETEYLANNKQLLALRKELNVNDANYQKNLQDINGKLNENNKWIKANVSDYEKQKISVGGYAEGVKEALGELNLFNGGLSQSGPMAKVAQIGFKSITATISEVKDSFEQAKQAQATYKQAQEMSVIATDKANKLTDEAAEIGFKYAQGKATMADVEVAETAAKEANIVATNMQTTATVAGTVATNASSGALKLLKVALISTGIGAIVVVLGSLIGYLTSTQEGINMVTSVTRPLQAIFSSLMGVFQNVGKYLMGAFTNPKKAMTDIYEFVKQNLINRFTAFGKILEGIMELDFEKIADGTIQAATGVEDAIGKVKTMASDTGKFFDEAAKKGQQIDRLAKDIEVSQLKLNKAQIAYGDELDAQLLISKDTSRSFKEREAAALKIIEINSRMGAEEEAIILNKIEKLKIEQSLRAITNQDRQEMIDLEKALDEAQDKALNARLEQMKVISGARKEENAKAEKAAEDAKQKYQQQLQDAATLQQQELDKFLAAQGIRAKSLEEELAIAARVAKDKDAIAQTEFKAEMNAAKTKEAKLIAQNNLDIKLSQNKLELMEAQATAAVGFADQELKTIIDKNNLILENDKFLSDELFKQKQQALIDNAAAEQANFEKQLEVGKINQQQYEDAMFQVKEDNRIAQETLTNERTAAEKAAKYEVDKQAAVTEYEEKQLEEQTRHDAEVEKINQWLAEDKITVQQHEAFIRAENALTAQNKMRNNLQEHQSKIGMMQQVAGAIGDAFGQNKELAIAQANMNGAQAVLSIWAGQISGNPLIDTVIKAVLTATTVATTVKQIQSIKNQKKPQAPKFAKGGLMGVGGRSHSEGGTMFIGEDGTQFEAEQGELIGVMNRNAARHFMAFNDAFPAGSQRVAPSNYFASGGVVSRTSSQSIPIDYNEMTNSMAKAVATMPAPKVEVVDILSVSEQHVRVDDNSTY